MENKEPEAAADKREDLIKHYWSRLERSANLQCRDDWLAHRLATEIDTVLDLGLTLKLADYVERMKQLRRPRRGARSLVKLAHRRDE